MLACVEGVRFMIDASQSIIGCFDFLPKEKLPQMI